jgi:hypothetical protein
LLKLLLPAVEVEVLPLGPPGGVGDPASSDRAPNEPIVDERPLSPKCGWPLLFPVERAERVDLYESLRKRVPEPGEAKFKAPAARATCDAVGTGGVCVPGSPLSTRRAVNGGLPVGECWVEAELLPPVEARGVAGAVSGNCGGSIFIGRGNRDARCFRRPKPNRAEPTRDGWFGRGVCSKDMCPPELPSDLDDSEALVAGGARELALSPDARDWASTSARR